MLVIKNISGNFHLVEFRSFLLVYESLDLGKKKHFYIKHRVQNYFKSFKQFCCDRAMERRGVKKPKTKTCDTHIKYSRESMLPTKILNIPGHLVRVLISLLICFLVNSRLYIEVICCRLSSDFVVCPRGSCLLTFKGGWTQQYAVPNCLLTE